MTRSPEQAQQAASLNIRVAAAHRTALTLVLAFAMSIVIYVGVGLLILNLRKGNTRTELPYGFYAAAAGLAIGSIVIRRAQLHRMKLEVVAATRGAEGLIKHLLNATILAAAIAEIIGVLALVVAFFGGDQNDVIRLGIVALMVSLYNYPRRSAWQRAVDYFSATAEGAGEGRLGL
ncbi:MAG: hypothetical protein AABO57_09115 [Acidobacteriota bacterium]